MSDKPAVYWVQDSCGVNTCHKNDGRLDLKQALIGTLDYRSDGWHIILSDGKDIAPDGLDSLYKARCRLEAYYNKSSSENDSGDSCMSSCDSHKYPTTKREIHGDTLRRVYSDWDKTRETPTPRDAKPGKI